jgi:stage V sporulation protein B
MAEKRESSARARQAGRGVISIAFAKFYFIVASAIIEFRLPVILGSTVFGAYRLVASTVSPLNNVLITGTIQAVSRFTAQRPERARAVQRAGLSMHLRVGLPIALAFIALAPLFALFYRDMSKVGPLMLAGLIVAGYAFYAVLVGTANGMRQFHKQAALDVCFATLRAGGVLGLALLGFGLYGAVGGWVIAVGAILVVSSIAVGLPGRAESKADAAPMTKFFFSVALYLILLNLLMFVDQLLLKRLSTEWFMANAQSIQATLEHRLPPSFLVAVEDGVDAAQAADGQVGLYAAVQNLARLSYQAIIAATFVVFPLVSRSTFTSDREATRAYIQTTLRYALIFAAAIAVTFAANPGDLLGIPYPAEFAYIGGPALVALALGNVAFSVFAISGTILNGAGLTRPAIAVSAVTLALAVIGNAIVIPQFPPGRELLLACGLATGGSMMVGAALAGYVLRARLGAFMPLLTVLRVALAAAAAIGLSRLVQAETSLQILGEATGVGLVFLAMLVLTRELTGRDLAAVLGVLRKRRGGDS